MKVWGFPLASEPNEYTAAPPLNRSKAAGLGFSLVKQFGKGEDNQQNFAFIEQWRGRSSCKSKGSMEGQGSIRHIPFRSTKNPRYRSAVVVPSSTPTSSTSERAISGLPNSIVPSKGTSDASAATTSQTSSESSKRGRKRRSIVQLKVARRGGKIFIEPSGDKQFKYKDPKSAREYQYTTQFGIIIKREYPRFNWEKGGRSCPYPTHSSQLGWLPILRMILAK